MHSNRVSLESAELYYQQWGTGKTPLLLFHGFGQDHRIFEELVPALSAAYTMYSFDLFFHGDSTWKAKRPLEKKDWEIILTQFLTKEGITYFAVAGYSMGGKFALATLELFPDRVSSVFLLAPDGIEKNFWYSLATGSLPVRALFRSMVTRPGRFQDIVRLFRSAGIVQNGVLRFAESQMDTEEKRKRVYDSWTIFRKLNFNIGKIARIMNDRKIPVTIILGSYDKMIPPTSVETFKKKLENAHVNILPVGHNDIIHNAAEFFM